MKTPPVSGALLDRIEPIESPSVNEIAQEKLLELIAAGQLQPGDRLPSQRVLAERLGISQVPLREALRSLEALGLVEAKVGSGWYVKNYSFDGIAKALAPRLNLSERSLYDLDEIRTHLECAYLRDAVQTLTPEKMALLEQALDGMDRLKTDLEKFPVFIEQDRRFHVVLFSGVPNQLLIELIEMFFTLRTYLAAWIQSDPEREGPTPEQMLQDMMTVAEKHREFFEVIRAGDIEEAIELRRKRLGGSATWD